jgi:hypothetical protein
MPESVMVLVICLSYNLMVPHVPHNGKGAAEENQFHDCVVQGQEDSK